MDCWCFMWLLLAAMSSEDTCDSIVSKQISATTVKLNNTNYILWAKSFRLFVCSQKLKHLSEHPGTKSTTFNDRVSNDCSMMTWLHNSMDEVNASAMFLKMKKRYVILWRRCISTSKISLMLLICMRSYSHCNKMVAIWLLLELKETLDVLDSIKP